jgi:putative ABC transport system substrate-binding protein
VTLAAQALGVDLHVLEVRRVDELANAFAAVARQGADALIVLQVGILNFGVSGPGQLVDLAAHNRLPTMYTRQETVAAGGLMSYGPNIPDNWRRATIYIDKALKGANPADLPVQ